VDYAVPINLLRLAAAELRATTRRPIPRDPVRTLPPSALRHARRLVRLSQRQLAQEFPYGRSLIAEVERGKRSCPPDLAAWARRVLRTTTTGSVPEAVPLLLEEPEDAVAGG